jgi:hypothetical protein
MVWQFIFLFLSSTNMFPSSSSVHFVYMCTVIPLKLPQKFKYKSFFSASIPHSTNSNVAPLMSCPLVFSEFNKGKVDIVIDGDPITFANGASTLSNPSTSRIDHVDFIADEKGEKVIVVAKKKQKAKWELNRTFQDAWAAKFPWAEPVVGLDGKVKMVQCKVCSTIEQMEKLFVPKLDGLRKHNSRRMCKVGRLGRVLGKSYISSNSQHVWNEKIYAITGHYGIQLQVEKHSKVKKKKIMCNLLPFSIF